MLGSNGYSRDNRLAAITFTTSENCQMLTIEQLFNNNRTWAEANRAQDPDFFSRLANQQSPQYLWIGCSDSRVPANQIVGLAPGEVFVHRNIANLVVHTDLNALSVIQYAVDALKVKHILVVGHYGCGGVRAALNNTRIGLADNWLRHVQDIRDAHTEQLAMMDDGQQRHDRLCELNVMQQVVNICQTSVLADAWERGQDVRVHGWCYALHDGLIRNLDINVGCREEALDRFRDAARPERRP
jgi:carbonic anhydrase